MSALIKLISPFLTNAYFWGGIIAALGILAAWIYLNGRASGKAAEKRKALKQELKERAKYEKGFNSGLNMSTSERIDWVRKYQGKK